VRDERQLRASGVREDCARPAGLHVVLCSRGASVEEASERIERQHNSAAATTATTTNTAATTAATTKARAASHSRSRASSCSERRRKAETINSGWVVDGLPANAATRLRIRRGSRVSAQPVDSKW